MRKIIVLFLVIIQVASAYGQVKVWEHWSMQFVSDKNYVNPYSDVMLKAEFTGPGNAKYETYGYWTGGQNYEISFCFPVQGTWHWELSCSDSENQGLNNNSGNVDVKKYSGTNKLYRNGFLKVSDDNRYLIYNNNKPFLWMGCTAWNGPVASTMNEWKVYIDDRAKKHFSVIHITPFNKWGQRSNMKNIPGDLIPVVRKNSDGHEPFAGYFDKINPAYWLNLAEKIQYANDKGLVVVLVGIPGWQFYFENSEQQKAFAQYLTGLLAGNFVIYSPSSDSRYSPQSDIMAMIIDSMDCRHLITQHPGTPSGQLKNVIAEEYYDKPYLDFSMCQSGHNGGRRDRCTFNSIYWNLSLYNREPHKPVVNGEAFYHGNKQASEEKYRGTDTDARSNGWYSWLSGAVGYTYGVLGIWNWGVESGGVFVPWEEAMQLNSSFQMQYMSQFLNKINWWELCPDTAAILNQPKDTIARMAFAKNEKGTLAVAYLPNHTGVEINMNLFQSPVKAQWFNPRNNRISSISGKFENSGSNFFKPPSGEPGDWVLLMKCK